MLSRPEDGFLIFTDGSCSTRSRVGGWAWVAVDITRGHASYAGWEEDTTISRMELMGPIMALEALYADWGPCEVEIASDSQYVVLGITNPQRKRKCHIDLWSHLEDNVRLHEYVQWRHIKGHAGHRWNEMADELAVKARKDRECHVKS